MSTIATVVVLSLGLVINEASLAHEDESCRARSRGGRRGASIARCRS